MPFMYFAKNWLFSIAISCVLAAGVPALRKSFHFLALMAATYGAIIAGKQVWLLSHPESSCGMDPLELMINQFQLTQSLPWLFKADGLCSARLPAILGLQVPEWSLLWFCVILFLLAFAFIKSLKTGG